MSERTSQIGGEVWIVDTDTAKLRVSQIGYEVWGNKPIVNQFPIPSNVRTSQIGLEVWINVQPAPPPLVVKPGGYIIERFDNRVWPTVETTWCVDCGFTLAQPTPNADLAILPIS